VPHIEWTLNNVRHESTHQTPSAFFLKHSKHNPLTQFIPFPGHDLPNNYKSKLILAQDNQLTKSEVRKKKHRENLNPIQFNINDLIVVQTHKLSNQIDNKISKFFIFYEGPYKIRNIKSVIAYEFVE